MTSEQWEAIKPLLREWVEVNQRDHERFMRQLDRAMVIDEWISWSLVGVVYAVALFTLGRLGGFL